MPDCPAGKRGLKHLPVAEVIRVAPGKVRYQGPLPLDWAARKSF
jgi:hypothetical protein